MSRRGRQTVRKPATKFPHLRKKLARAKYGARPKGKKG
jgi:hypothetical protein